MATSSARLDELKKKFDENPRRYFAPLANEYRKLGDLTQAIALCRAHLPNQPGHISGHIVLAQALYEARELGESRGIFEAALDLDPENLIALRYLGDIAREQGEPLQARGWYERVLDADPRNDEIAALLKELEGEVARASQVVAPSDAGFAFADDLGTPAPVPVDVAPAAVDAPFPFTHTTAGSAEPPASASFVDAPEAPTSELFVAAAEAPTSDPFFAAAEAPASDPFFGEAEAAPTIAAGDLEGAADSSFDDWFAAPAAPAAAPAAIPEGYATTSAELSESDVEASLGFEAIHLAPSETAAADGLEASFFPDLASVTPPGSPLIPSVETPLDVNAVTPPFVLAQPEATGAIPTPPFLQSIDDEPAAKAEGEDDQFASEFESVGELSDEQPSWSAPVDRSSEGVASAEFAGDVESAAEPATAGDVASFPSYGVFETFESDGPAGSAVDAELPQAVDAVEAVVGDEVVAAAEAFDAVGATSGSSTEEEIGAYEPEEASGQQASPVAGSMEGFEPGEFTLGETDRFASDATSDLEVEYGEFASPAADDVPYIASSISVPLDALDAPDAYTAGAPELSAHEPFPMEEQYRSEEFANGALLGGAPTPTWSEAQAPSLDAIPVDGLESRGIAAAAEQPEDSPVFEAVTAPDPAAAVPLDEGALDEEEAPAGTAFVTETMAELYLQQGFTDEALAIYRQLLAQQPGDASLAHRVAALERGGHSAVLDGVAPRDHRADRASQSVRGFFGHFARRQPRNRRRSARPEGESEGSDAHGGETSSAPFGADAAVRVDGGAFAGVATREEALTVPDEPREGSTPTATLAQLFQAGQVSPADDRAASALASAFGSGAQDDSGNSGDGQLSLEHLFRDVPARSSGAVTLDEFYEGSSPRDAAEGSGGATGETDADIEQFTAWLEGLKKK